MMSPKTIMRRFKGNLYAPLCNQFPTIACLHLCIFHTPHVSQCARLYHSGLSFTAAQFSQNISEVGFEFLTASLVWYFFRDLSTNPIFCSIMLFFRNFCENTILKLILVLAYTDQVF